jgi:thiosulfate dehydrogenase
MHAIDTAAAFIWRNMPLGAGERLTNQQNGDVAVFVNSHEPGYCVGSHENGRYI